MSGIKGPRTTRREFGRGGARYATDGGSTEGHALRYVRSLEVPNDNVTTPVGEVVYDGLVLEGALKHWYPKVLVAKSTTQGLHSTPVASNPVRFRRPTKLPWAHPLRARLRAASRTGRLSSARRDCGPPGRRHIGPRDRGGRTPPGERTSTGDRRSRARVHLAILGRGHSLSSLAFAPILFRPSVFA